MSNKTNVQDELPESLPVGSTTTYRLGLVARLVVLGRVADGFTLGQLGLELGGNRKRVHG